MSRSESYACIVNGWLGTARATRKLVGKRTKLEVAIDAAKAVANLRAGYGLDLPYGRQAKALGLGEETPPSERGEPPGAAVETPPTHGEPPGAE